MYLNGNKYTEKRVARSHNVLRLKGEFVDKYVGLHVRSLYNDSSALNFDIVKKDVAQCLSRYDNDIKVQRHCRDEKLAAAAAAVAATSTTILVDLYNRRMALC